MRIAQITDTHVALDCPSRTENFERCVAQINSLDAIPDLVVHCGDVSHNGLPEEYAVARRIMEKLKCPWVVMAGNKDNRAAMREAFPQTAIPRCDFDFVQYGLEQFDLRILCLDTVSENSNKGEMCAQRLGDFRSLIEAGRGKPALIFMHHPPFEVSTIPEPFQFERRQAVEEFLEIVSGRPEVRSIYCGHVHRPYQASVAGIPAVVMTAVALDLRKGKPEPVTESTPLYLLHEADAGEGERSAQRQADRSVGA